MPNVNPNEVADAIIRLGDHWPYAKFFLAAVVLSICVSIVLRARCKK